MAENDSPPLSRSRYRGCLLGLAVGDAIGTTAEFSQPGSFTPLTDMVGGGPFNLSPGEWTDDTSMALCLAESLIEKGEFDPVDQLERYVRWYRTGYHSSNGRCFDIGITTCNSLHRFEQTKDPFPGPDTPYSAGNGSLMRLAPVPMVYARYPAIAIVKCADSSRTTHGNPKSLDACRYFGFLLLLALAGHPKDVILSPLASWQNFNSETLALLSNLSPEIMEVAMGSYKNKQPPAIQGSSYVVRSLEAALWAFHNASHFRDGVLMAANLGEDADTTAAIYGQLAGAYFGEENIPAEWRCRVVMGDLIIEMADNLYELSQRL